jgi:hypothetical protein
MAGYYIGIHARTVDPLPVHDAVASVFAEEGFQRIQDAPAASVVEDDDALPDGEDWYGVLVSGRAGDGWVSVYVDDWQDSGVIARALSASLTVPVLEVWVAEDVHWGYTYYESGGIKDRFADDPSRVADDPDEAALYTGDTHALAAIQSASPTAPRLDAVLEKARAASGQFAGAAIDDLANAVGIPFEHLFTGYEYFFHDDPADYAQDLTDWPAFRHLAFVHPEGRDQLAD